MRKVSIVGLTISATISVALLPAFAHGGDDHDQHAPSTQKDGMPKMDHSNMQMPGREKQKHHMSGKDHNKMKMPAKDQSKKKSPAIDHSKMKM